MSNVIIVTGGLSQPIVAGTPLTNGPNFPIKYFLLAYDPNTDPDIHTAGGVTSAQPFSAVATYGDTSLIQRGGHFIFNKTDYTLSQEQFVILSGAVGSSVFNETQYDSTTVRNSDKSHSTVITLSGGKPLLNVISGTSPADLYPIEPVGSWHTSQTLANRLVAQTGSIALTADASNYFPIESYTPILASAGTPDNLLRGVFKCRVGSSYGDFKFNKVGIYIDGGVGNPPVLIAIAMLNTAVTKTKTGNSITNLEFDIEIEFHTNGTFSNVVYMTSDYWVKVPTNIGYGLFTDTDVAIGSSGVGWAPKAKLDISSENNGRPILCLNNRYNSNYMFMDVDYVADNSAISGSSTMSIYTTSHTMDTALKYIAQFNKYVDYTSTGPIGADMGYDAIGDLTNIVKHGLYVSQNKSVTNFNNYPIDRMTGIMSNIINLNGTKDVIGVYSKVRHAGSVARTTVGGYFEVNSIDSANADCNKYGIWTNVVGRGTFMYGIRATVSGSSANSLYPMYGAFIEIYGGKETNYGIKVATNGNVGTLNAYGVYSETYGGDSDSYGVYGIGRGVSTLNVIGVYGQGLATTVNQLTAKGGSFIASTSYTTDYLTDIYGIQTQAQRSGSTSKAKRMFGIHSSVASDVAVGNYSEAYGGYFRAPAIVNSYAISADGNVYIRGNTSIIGGFYISGDTDLNALNILGLLKVNSDATFYNPVTCQSTLQLNGNVTAANTVNIDTLNVLDYTTFGSDSGNIRLKCIAITFVSHVSLNGVTVVPHGLLGVGRIVSINCIINSGVSGVPQSVSRDSGIFYYDLVCDSTNIYVQNGPSLMSNLRNKSGIIQIWYTS